MSRPPLADLLDLEPHPEGGWYRRTWTSPGETTRHVVGTDLAAGQEPQVLVPAGTWQRTVATDHDALVSCVVSPGFSFDDFALA